VIHVVSECCPEPTVPAVNPSIDVSVPNSARIWNYWLGGRDYYEVDRIVGDQIARGYPQVFKVARYARAFLGRAVTFLAGEVGIRQFLDIGSGLPAADNVHEVARRVAADCRVVYVDSDPMVLSHVRARLLDPADPLLHGFEADIARPEAVLSMASEHLDLHRPVAVVLSNVLGHLPTLELASRVVRRLMAPLPAGSHLVVADSTNVIDGAATTKAISLWNETASATYQLRSPAEIARLFDGLELLEPGIVSCPHWRPQILTPDPVDEFCGVGRKN
jgi:hypothetical protein